MGRERQSGQHPLRSSNRLLEGPPARRIPKFRDLHQGGCRQPAGRLSKIKASGLVSRADGYWPDRTPAAELLQLPLRTPLQPSPSSNWRLKPQDFWCGEDGNGDGEQEAAGNGSGYDFWKPAKQTPELAGTHRTRQHMGVLTALAILAGIRVSSF